MSDDATLPPTPSPDAAGPGPDPALADVAGWVGPYQIVRRLGRGGMGEVYLAQQSAPVRRQVALKVVKLGMDTREVLTRFQAERQALAQLNHPCIAKMLDAGQTERGRPYFVMEYVDGPPITEYANAHQLTVEQRLDLFMQVCAGVQHAHQKALIHRDLKPSNILVAEQDGKPVPKIIDFGIAKAIEPTADGETLFTQLGQIVGTPAYMSPEQAEPTSTDIDTRTDVYSLGVILYELLVDALPFERDELLAAGYEGILRVIREQEPPRPSARLREVTEQTTLVATRRITETGRLHRMLQGDLDWIVMKALEKDRARRYETANAFAMDVRRFLEQEPVLASPPSASYRLRKLVRRNRGTFTALASVAVVLVVAAVVSSILFVRAERASRIARREASKATQVSQFLGNMLGGVGPQVAKGRDTQMLRAILDETAERVGKELAEQPEVEATLRLQLGDTYRQLGEYKAAQQQLDRIRQLQAAAGLTAPDPVRVLNAAGNLAWNRGDLKTAEQSFRQALDHLVGSSAADSLAQAEIGMYLANVLAEQGSYGEADTLMHRSLAVYRAQPEQSDGLAVTLNSLGNLSRYQGNLPAAEEFYREALAIHRKVWGDIHPFVATDLHNLGKLLEAMGKGEPAEQALREALAMQQRLFDGPHPEIAMTLQALSELAVGAERFDAADSLAHAAYDIMRSFYGEDHESTIRALMAVAEVQSGRGQLREAESTYSKLVEICRRPEISAPGLLPDALYRLATTMMKQGRGREALKGFSEAVERSTALSGADHPDALLFRNDYARALSGLGDDEAAMQQLRQVLAARERVLGGSHPETAITRVDLGRSLWRLGKLDEAEGLIRRGRDDYAAAKGEDHPGRWIATIHLASVLRDLGRLDEAEGELVGARAFYLKRGGASDPQLRVVASKLSTVYLKGGRRTDADRLMQEALDESRAPLEPRLRGEILRDRGETLLTSGQPGAAEQPLLASYAALEGAVGITNTTTQYTVRLLARAYDQLGNPKAAATWRAKLL